MNTMQRMSVSFEEVTESTPRYERHFEEIKRLGKGGYGSVYKCKNKLEEKMYAIKIVKLKHPQSKERTRAEAEVKALANLHHKSIVRYHTAWIEQGVNVSPSAASLLSETEAGTDDTEDQFDSSETEGGTPLCNEKNVPVSLYIQMELCDTTLKDWMVKRNESFENEEEFLLYLKNDENILIFKRILKAVEYIHDKGLIHRDLKPQNIFMLENKMIKVGDFGLVTEDILNEDPCSPGGTGLVRKDSGRSRHTSGVGTPTYAAPEQVHVDGSVYTNKADIYSLGLILFELYQKFDTDMEKYKTLDKLRQGQLPPNMQECWPLQTHYVERMISIDTEIRPSAKQILEDCNLFMSKDQIIAEMREKETTITKCMNQLEISSERAKKQLKFKKKAVDKWRKRSLGYSNEVSRLKGTLSMKEMMMEAEMNAYKDQLKQSMDAKEAEYKKEIRQLKSKLRKKTKQIKGKDHLLSEKNVVISGLLDQFVTEQTEALSLL